MHYGQWALLEKQPRGPHGEGGVLFCVSGSIVSDPNVFFIRGTDGNLWQVDLYWGELDPYDPWRMGWVLYAKSIQEGLIDRGYRVISR